MTTHTGRPRGLLPDAPKITSLRLELGITQAELGARCRVHAETVSRAERGRPIADYSAARLAKALGVKLQDIIKPPEVAKVALDASKAPAAVHDRGTGSGTIPLPSVTNG